MPDLLAYVPPAASIIVTALTIYAALNARSASIAAQKADEGVIVVNGKVYDLGKSVDGRLTALLKASEDKAVISANLAHAEGKAEGEQAQRDRSNPAEPQP